MLFREVVEDCPETGHPRVAGALREVRTGRDGCEDICRCKVEGSFLPRRCDERCGDVGDMFACVDRLDCLDVGFEDLRDCGAAPRAFGRAISFCCSSNASAASSVVKALRRRLPLRSLQSA